jgi:chemotaxis protein methyltransferase CheR
LTVPAITEEAYLLLNELIGEWYGIDFPDHRREILEARLRSRLTALRLPSFWDYYLHLRTDSVRNCDNGERRRLAELVTNNETFFFRETRQLESFLTEAVPRLWSSPEPLRVLCAGCSSGDEAYTLRILAGSVAMTIDAFDVDASRVEAAQLAEYGPGSLRQSSPEQVERYFRPSGEKKWELRSPWRRDVRFAWGNLMDLASFRADRLYDAVFCRNVLIYFSPAALRRAVCNLAAVLRPGGLLFLGAAESIIGLSASFETVRLSTTIAYRRVPP